MQYHLIKETIKKYPRFTLYGMYKVLTEIIFDGSKKELKIFLYNECENEINYEV